MTTRRKGGAVIVLLLFVSCLPAITLGLALGPPTTDYLLAWTFAGITPFIAAILLIVRKTVDEDEASRHTTDPPDKVRPRFPRIVVEKSLEADAWRDSVTGDATAMAGTAEQAPSIPREPAHTQMRPPPMPKPPDLRIVHSDGKPMGDLRKRMKK